ncbi:MAG: DUF4190 domain-containing protein [Planctomycetes bacterium]|nr:DUF4190 domain-containing protein [Planctomycetota bacterium]
MLLEKVHEGFEVPCPACDHRFLVPAGATDVPAPPAAVAPEAPPPVRAYPDAPPPVRYGDASDDCTIVLVLGIVSVVAVPLLGPVAWILGHRARSRARAEGRQPPTNATVGWVLGIVGTAFLLLVGCFLSFMIAAVFRSR